jgi:hypothetical protein
MTRSKFIDGIQSRVAKVSVGSSTVRGQGAPGILPVAREFLGKLQLQRFSTKSGVQFLNLLDQTTDKLEEILPRKARSWGLARKCVNLFLRDSFYNGYLENEYGLSMGEAFYEIPLDGIVAGALIVLADRNLPKWEGVKYLKQPASDIYHAFAAREAGRRGISRVHLDTFLWK